MDQLLERSIGPLNFRLVVMPTFVTILAIRSGLRDARDGRQAFLWGIIAHPVDRRHQLLSAWRDIARVFLVAVVLDTIYQAMVFRTFLIGQVLIVAVLCAILPYVLFRGPVTRLVRGLSRVGPAAIKSPNDATDG